MQLAAVALDQRLLALAEAMHQRTQAMVAMRHWMVMMVRPIQALVAVRVVQALIVGAVLVLMA